MIDETHNPGLQSWVESANEEEAGFPIQNLPFGVFSDTEDARVGVAIGDRVLDVTACVRERLLERTRASAACAAGSLNSLMALDRSDLRSFRKELSDLLRADTEQGERAAQVEQVILRRADEVTLEMPVVIGDYTDFYSSVNHATNVGSMFRPDNPLLPNYKYVPIGYHGRASSIVRNGTAIRRPQGQTKAADSIAPQFGASKMLDYECELGFFASGGNRLGDTIPISRATDHIFGFCLVNDWSARDIQAWEYQPLGPFLAKNFATTISSWVVTADAVEPYRTAVSPRPDGDPMPLDYLDSHEDREGGAINAFLEVYLTTERTRAEGSSPVRLSRAPFSSMYWTVAQMLAHHASNGCNLRPGDLLASGTVSGDTPDSRGCLLELTWRGTQPVTLPNGEERRFLQNGDEVIMKGSLEAAGMKTIGFGECRGIVLPASD